MQLPPPILGIQVHDFPHRMETHDVAKVEETMPDHCTFKVHHLMCKQLKELVDRITNILPDIEAARPRCKSGIEALCLLNSAVERTKQLLQSCIKSSKLYLATTGDAILSHCRKSKHLLEQSLCQIQTMVPVMLAAEISRIIDDLKATTFALDSSEEEAGKALLELHHRATSPSDLLENREKRAFQLAASRLHLTSRKAVVSEIRAIKKLLTKVGEKEHHNKRKILNYFVHLLKKYGSLTAGEQRSGRNAQDDGLARIGISSVNSPSAEVESRLSVGQDEAQIDTLSSSTLPKKLMRPTSERLMYDPVLIASGFTFERMWIQMWFDEGNDTCPKTNMELADFSLTSNKVAKDQISEWSLKNGVGIADPNRKQVDLKDGSELLLAFLSKNRKEMECLNEDASSVMTSFLESDITEEALATLEILSVYPHCRSKFSESGALVPLLNLLESPSKKFQEPVIKILHNVSSNVDICSQIVSLGCIPKLVPYISDGKLARFCIVLVKNLCDTEEARVSVAETNGCIASIAKLLESGSHEEQEHAVDVLLSLCSMRVEYCRLAMDEGIIPSLVYISNNGTEKGKVRALELLRQLRDVDYEDGQDSLGSDLDPDGEASQFTEENRSSSKARGFFKKIFALFHNVISSPRRRKVDM